MDNIEEKRMTYEPPFTKKTLVEMEGNLCSSVDMTASSPYGVDVKSQDVNTDFGNDNNFLDNDNSWE